jgi:hypothetical protein
MRTYRRLMTLTALTAIGLTGTIVLHGGWEAAAAGLGMLAGCGAAVTFAFVRALGERPRSRRPSWSEPPAALRPAAPGATTRAATGRRRAPVEARPPHRRPLAPRPARTV